MSLSALARPLGPAPNQVLSWRPEGAGTVIDLRGEADVVAVPALVELLATVAAERQGSVVIDLAAARFIDSAIVRTLSRAQQFLAEHDRELTVRSPSEQARRLLTFAGCSDLIASDPMRREMARAAHPSAPAPKATPPGGPRPAWGRPDEPPPAA